MAKRVTVEFTVRTVSYATGQIKVNPKRFKKAVGKPFDIETLTEADLIDYVMNEQKAVGVFGHTSGEDEWTDFEVQGQGD